MICGGGLTRATRFSLMITGEAYKGLENNVVDYQPPGVTQASVPQPGPMRDIPWPGTKLVFDDLTITVLLNTGMQNLISIYQWMRNNRNDDEVHDVVVMGYDTANKLVFQQRFFDAFPISLSQDGFSTTDSSDTPLKFRVAFQYTDMVFE